MTTVAGAQHRPQHSSGSDDNTNSDLQNISDFSDDDSGLRAASEMSRQSSSRFSESRPLIYSGSSTSTSPGHSATTEQPQYNQTARPGPAKFVTRPRYQEEVYAYAATDFSSGGQQVPEQVQSQVQSQVQ